MNVAEINRLRAEVLMNYYSAERRAGATPEQAHERLGFFAKRLDALFDRGDTYVYRGSTR